MASLFDFIHKVYASLGVLGDVRSFSGYELNVVFVLHLFQIKSVIAEGLDGLLKVVDSVLAFADSFVKAAEKLNDRLTAVICSGLRKGVESVRTLFDQFQLR